MKNLSPWDQEEIKMQGRLFQRAGAIGLDMQAFAEIFMNSEFAARLDASYDPLQERGEAYILESLLESCQIPLSDKKDCPCQLEWVGKTYRLWCCGSGISSRKAYENRPFSEMCRLYCQLNAMCEERLIEYLNEEVRS